MYIIWSGLGFLVGIIGFAAIVFSALISDSITGNPNWVLTVGFILAALITYGLNVLLMKQKGKIVIDKETNEEIELRRKHSFFFIPLKSSGGTIFL